MSTRQAALYARVSSEHQADANTIARQVTALQERAHADGARKRSRHRRKETLVARRTRRNPQLREIHCTFEPSRLSPSWVAQAYEQIVPMVRRPTSRSPRPGSDELEQRENRTTQCAVSSRE